ncbi:hypothetical protein CAI21_12620 [Alkalilimnicola ehrlichii]|uniref:Ketosynthase family 3 (KS3) domain-containing protein n=1 Tax=Alkalilimnicola ehrlichii TaxID=351052 RepID=A0A3E0X1V8_9GAMM|nr:type I polyketide synthase [Alkalilimnicola ehrlichii]RFA28407.1 hypothetical protein CAI21_12620 [Alkalilimnicola ehrlichii]RFA38528.1 hypothetical protein CAL65_04040 [Alkalilimnicola ehrlichii]
MEAIEGIAIIGMAGRFPGARGIAQFWENLTQGVESVTELSEEALQQAGVGQSLYGEDNYVRAATLLDDIDLFDAAFFNIPAREALVVDPQHRVFLECCWEALETAGYVPDAYEGAIGVYAGASLNTYLIHNLACQPALLSTPEGFQALVGNEKDYLATRVAYKLNLRGPAVSVQTACSTSLAAVHLAAQSLYLGECDMALAGGVSVKVPQTVGYLHQDGMPFSKDGHCRTFDEKASGTVFGSGAGVVLLKRLQDAIDDGDNILAVIRASSMNNDGSAKVGFTAPSSEGQADVIAQTLALADVPAESIGYIEAHGTGTPLGDPIEVAALTDVYSAETSRTGYCAIGSVKTNVGHLETASGITGLIKVVQMLRHGTWVPSLGFDKPNPEIDFAKTPFFVNTKTQPWPMQGDTPRRAAVSSFGMGGTNVHAILEQAPESEAPALPKRDFYIMTLSARTRESLDSMTANLRSWMADNMDADPHRIAATLQLGRKGFEYRRAFVCRDLIDAVEVLDGNDPGRLLTTHTKGPRKPAFLFAGGGAQYPGMAADLYQRDAAFAADVDECAMQFQPLIEEDIRRFMLAKSDDLALAARMCDPDVMFPALFTVQYAMARYFLARGIEPAAMVGHSNGEYVVACLSGVMSLATAIRMVALRSTLMMKMAPGAMVAVPLPEEEVLPLLVGSPLSIAAVNGPKTTVLSGEKAEVDAFVERLAREKKVEAKSVHVNAGLHSYLTDSIRIEFEQGIAGLELQAPEIPYVSCVTGEWATSDEVKDPAYWGRHLRQTVLYKDAVNTLMEKDDYVLLDMGPGQVVGALARQIADGQRWDVISASRQIDDVVNDEEYALSAVARLWMVGAELDWLSFYNGKKPRPMVLPTYAFQRKRYWIAPRVSMPPMQRKRRTGPSCLRRKIAKTRRKSALPGVRR